MKVINIATIEGRGLLWLAELALKGKPPKGLLSLINYSDQLDKLIERYKIELAYWGKHGDSKPWEAGCAEFDCAEYRDSHCTDHGWRGANPTEAVLRAIVAKAFYDYSLPYTLAKPGGYQFGILDTAKLAHSLPDFIPVEVM